MGGFAVTGKTVTQSKSAGNGTSWVSVIDVSGRGILVFYGFTIPTANTVNLELTIDSVAKVNDVAIEQGINTYGVQYTFPVHIQFNTAAKVRLKQDSAGTGTYNVMVIYA